MTTSQLFRIPNSLQSIAAKIFNHS